MAKGDSIMKEKFEEAALLFFSFDAKDIITTSGNNDLGGDNEMPLE